jgi:hypothetical protein
MPDVPALLQSVTLLLERTTGESFMVPTKVLDLEPEGATTCVVVACPEGCDPREHHLDAWLTWTEPRGLVSVPVTTHPAQRAYGRVWRVITAGRAIRQQDRRYFRADLSAPVRMTWSAAGMRSQRRQGSTVDLSEGGALVLVRGAPPRIGAVVEVVIAVEGGELRTGATVVRHETLPGGTAVGLAFDEPSSHGDELRRAVVAAERRSLRAAR